ncbi:MAG: VWA domain-containing protein [Planctomycetes bacterium]|nr:VWA domain-containing protein [Planctomycetota bacterium]
MSLPEVAFSIEPPSPQPIPPVPEAVPVRSPPKPQPEPPAVALPNGPLAPAVPRTLPPELLPLIRKPAPAVHAPGVPNPPVVDPNVRPAGASESATDVTPAIHGALKANQTVVYVVDCSGSMGASGKLDAARAALVSTLKQQPTSVRFQIVAYAGTAVPLLTGNGAALPANEASVRAAAEQLAKLEARGRSNHLEAVRTALAFRPDVVLLLTDADDLNGPALRAAAPKSVLLCVGRVTAQSVEPPRELK